VEFEKRFKSKTGLTWENRGGEAKAGKYTVVERAYEGGDAGDADADDDGGGKQNGKVKSELDISTQRLMELIFK